MDESSPDQPSDDSSTSGAAPAAPDATAATDAASARTAVRHETIGSEDAGSRLDRVLARLLPGVPHTRLFRLLRKGEVRINGRRASGEVRLAEGDVLRIPPVALQMPPTEGTENSRAAARLTHQIEHAIIHEDERLLVVNKPSGIAVHGGSGVSAGVIEALRASRPDETLELVHRLDRDTSGCLMIARRRSTLRSMHALLREHTADGQGSFDKRYLVLVRGKWELGRKRIEVPLATHTRVGGERTVMVAANGKPAASEFSVVQFFGNLATLLEVRLLTGRTHQIRVHAAYAGHPVAGDEKYGDEPFNRQMQGFALRRLFLHAHSVGFEDPERQVDVSISAPLPGELRKVLDVLGARAGKMRPAGGTFQPPAVRVPVRPARPTAAAPRRPRPAAGRPAPSGRGSRPTGRGSRRGPRT